MHDSSTKDVLIDGESRSLSICLHKGGYMGSKEDFELDYQPIWIVVGGKHIFGGNPLKGSKRMAKRLQSDDPRLARRYVNQLKTRLTIDQISDHMVALDNGVEKGLVQALEC